MIKRIDETLRVRASLIDRLVDHEPGSAFEKRSLKTLSVKELKQSVGQNLSWLFNTRTPLSGSIFDKEALTVIDYGLPDFGSFYTLNIEDIDLLQRRIAKVISAFEPRLKRVRVSVDINAINEKKLFVAISAEIVSREVGKTVSFLAEYNENSGVLEIDVNKRE